MTWTIPPFVSERQAGNWVDCGDCSALMAVDGHTPGRASATLAEAKALRYTSGFPATGGTSITPMVFDSGVKAQGLALGMKQRYGIYPTVIGGGFSSFWGAMTPGHAGFAIGRPTGASTSNPISSTSPIRRYQGTFSGLHIDLFLRLDSTNRLWLMDPCGPTTGYRGEWVSESDVAKFYVGNAAVLSLAPGLASKKLALKCAARPNATFGAAFGTLYAGTVIGVSGSVTGSRWYFGSVSGTKWYVAKTVNGHAVSAVFPGHSVVYVAAGAVSGG